MAGSTQQVVVHKASISLGDEETLHDYMSSLSAAFKEHLKTKQNLSDKDYIYTVEVGGDWCVGSVYYDTTGPNPPKVYVRHYKAAYKREDDGKFSFSSTTEVERVTRFEPVQKAARTKLYKDNGAPIQKAAPAPEPAPEAAPTPEQIESVHKAAWAPRVDWSGAL
jgi:hypothetical protein